MMKRRCDLCQFGWFPTSTMEGSISEWGGGYCRRYAPRPILEKDFGDAGESRDLAEVVSTTWPIVLAGHWCGEFMPQEGEQST